MSGFVTYTYTLGFGGFQFNLAQETELRRLVFKVSTLGSTPGAGAEIYDYLLSLVSTTIVDPVTGIATIVKNPDVDV